jgi:AraC family transcriptional activator of tynA and feaB
VSQHRLERMKDSGALADGWRVWDTSYVAERTRFTLYREAVCESFLSLSPERPDDGSFSARIEHLPLSSGAINRGMCSVSHKIVRTSADVAKIDGEFLHLNFPTSGQYALDQAGRQSVIDCGDAVLFSTSKPFTMDSKRRQGSSVISLLIPRQRVVATQKYEISLDNILVSQLRYGAPLRSCLAMLARRLNAGSRHEIEILNSAAISLLCAALLSNAQERPKAGLSLDDEPAILSAIRLFIRQNLTNPGLSAASVASQFGISRRYVDKLFQKEGQTFEAFSVGERLSCARLDLLDPAFLRQNVSTIAYRWGFHDMSTFHRNFKMVYGETPGSLRP